MTDTLGDRVFAIRAALGDGVRRPLSQDAFATLLTGRGERTYYGPDFSLIERNKKPVTLEDVALMASVDPLRRGKLWLAWGETEDATMKAPRRMGPSVIKEPPEDTFNQPIPRTKRPAKRTG